MVATPYALGRFRAHTDFGPRADDFTGVVVGSGVAPLAALLPAAPELDALLDDWPANVTLLGDVVDEARTGQRWASLARPVRDFARLAPLRPGQIFQSEANHRPGPATAPQEEQAAGGTPYVFIGLAPATCGPDDNVVLPAVGTRHDWEPELGVVIGTEAYRVDAGRALSHVAGYVIA